jgi:hypothetical protein
MKKQILPIVFIGLLACNTPAENKSGQTTASANNNQPQQTQTADQQPIPYYKANGNEPGFVLSINMAMNGSYDVTLVNNYGADTLHGTFNKAPLYDGTKPNMASNEIKLEGTFEGVNGGEAGQISIFAELCTDDAGLQKPSSCKIKFGKTQLSGCGAHID